jgi:hypothetical protein
MRSLPQHRSVQGRRPSVGPTTARRRPSVRRRPGAGFIPARRPAARVGAPRARFRVYGEDEYFAQGGQVAELARDGSGWPAASSVFSADVAAAEGAHGLRIAVGTALIAGAGALGVVLALGAFATSTHVRRKTALRAARANARTAGAASAIAAARTTHLRPKTISGRARRVGPATVVARPTRPARRSASARSWSNARSSKAGPSRPAAGQVLASSEVTAGAPALPDARGSSEGSHGRSTEMAATSNSSSRRGSGEFGFER